MKKSLFAALFGAFLFCGMLSAGETPAISIFDSARQRHLVFQSPEKPERRHQSGTGLVASGNRASRRQT